MIKSVCFSDNNIIYNIPSHEVVDVEVEVDEVVDVEVGDVKGPKSSDKIYTKYTKFCLFGLGKCKKGVKCVYAHTFKELNPITCKWDKECLRDKKCYFKHSIETKTQYVKRAFQDDMKRLNISLFDEQKKVVKKSYKECNKKEKKKSEEERVFDREEYIKCFIDIKLMYYDPILEVRCWGDIPDSDDDEPYPYF